MNPIRRHLLLAFALSVLGSRLALAAEPAPSPAAPPVARLAGWSAWKQTFIQPPGRVVDPGQGGISTSESQGFGLLLAASGDDRATFDALWTWTRNNLGVRDDGLFAWRWQPATGVTDRNDAADGDLLIAWALARAGQRFGDAAYTEAARRIAQAIRAHLLVPTAWGVVLMPALQGFDTAKGRVVNLSYWVFPAFAALDRIDPSPQWKAVTDAGLRLLQIARFGRWALPPDWLLLVDPLVPDPGRPQRYGYEAVRIPLYLYWAHLGTPELLAPFLEFWGSFQCKDYLPAWVNLNDDSIDSFGAPPGMRAIRTLAGTAKAPADASPPIARQDYYSATLGLLVELAREEGGRP
jgi:endoglucanase